MEIFGNLNLEKPQKKHNNSKYLMENHIEVRRGLCSIFSEMAVEDQKDIYGTVQSRPSADQQQPEPDGGDGAAWQEVTCAVGKRYPDALRSSSNTSDSGSSRLIC